MIQAVGVGRTFHHQESCIEEKLGTPDIQFGDKLFYHRITIEGDRDQKLFAFVSIDVSKIFLLSTMHLTANQLINHVLTTLCRTMIRQTALYMSLIYYSQYLTWPPEAVTELKKLKRMSYLKGTVGKK